MAFQENQVLATLASKDSQKNALEANRRKQETVLRRVQKLSVPILLGSRLWAHSIKEPGVKSVSLISHVESGPEKEDEISKSHEFPSRLPVSVIHPHQLVAISRADEITHSTLSGSMLLRLATSWALSRPLDPIGSIAPLFINTNEVRGDITTRVIEPRELASLLQSVMLSFNM